MTLEEIELLSELTIVIPTRNSPLDLERLIEFWRDTPVTIHILDGSDRPWFTTGVLLDARNITYHHFPPKDGELDSENYFERLRFAAQLPKTNFSALLGDEDFFTISGLCQCVRILKQNNEICSVIGVTTGFECTSSETNWGLREVAKYSLKMFKSPNVRKRLKSLISGEIPIVYYGIYRTDAWLKVLTLTFRHKFQSRLLGGERLLHASTFAVGQMVEINRILWLRKFWTKKDTFEHFSPDRGAYDRYVLDEANQKEVLKHYLVLAEAIQYGEPGWSRKRALRLSKKVLKPSFLSSQYGFKYRLRKKLARTLVRLGAVVPPRLRLSLNRSMGNKITKSLGFIEVDQKFRPALGRQELNTFLQGLARTEVVYDELEIRKVDELLRKPREELRLRANI